MLSPVSRLVGVVVLAAVLSLLAWSWSVPAVMSQSTFAAISIFLLGGIGVTLMTWRNAQATGSTAQLLHETEVAADGRSRM